MARTKTPRLAGLLFALATMFGVSSQQQATAQNRFRGDFMPGDGIRIIVWQDPSSAVADIQKLGIQKEYIISKQGAILLPLIGETTVVGKTKDELAEMLSERYKKYISGLYFVCLPLIRITVLGAINQPGSYLIEKSSSLWQLINEAGGPKPDANLKKIYLSRGGRVIAEELLNVYERAFTLEEIKVVSGDQIVLPAVSRITMSELIRYASFLMSGVSLYLQIRRR